MRSHYVVSRLLNIVLVCVVLLMLTACKRDVPDSDSQLPVAQPEVVEGATETFDNPDLPGWERSAGATVVDGVLRVEAGGFAALLSDPWSDLTLALRARRTGDGSLAIRYSASDAGAYVFRFGDASLSLIRDEGGTPAELAAAPASTPAGQWVQVDISVAAGMHTITLDGQLALTVTDPKPLLPGGVMLRADGGATGEFDDLVVTTKGKMPLPSEGQSSTQLPPSGETPSVGGAVGASPQRTEGWVRLGGPPGGLGYDIRYNFADPNTWYATDAYGGAHISTDNGLTWQSSNNGIPGQGGPSGDRIPVFSLTVDPHNPQIVWAGTQDTGHIYKSVDGGLTWSQKDDGVTIEYDLLSFRGITVDPRSSDVVYAMGETGEPPTWGPVNGGVVYKTTDGGEHWQVIWDGGMPSSLARYMWIDPQNPDTLYVSTGIFDRGAVGEAIDPTDNPDPLGGLGILKSTDGGETWRTLNEENGLGSLYIGSLYMHPDDPNILLAAAGKMIPASADEAVTQRFEQEGSPFGIYRTTDAGETWIQAYEPPIDRVGEVITSVEICSSDPNIAYAGSDMAMYRSEDAGQTWTTLTDGIVWGPPGVVAGFPIDLQCDPRDANRIFANNYNGGNFLSEDGGRTWRNASDGYTGAQLVSVAVDPFDPAHVYASGRSGPWESTDGGATWQSLALVDTPSEDQPDSSIIFIIMCDVAADPSQADHVLFGSEMLLERSESGWQPREIGDGTFLFTPTACVITFAPSEPSVIYIGAADPGCPLLHSHCDPTTGLAVSHDGGVTWQDIAGDTLSSASIMDLAVDPQDANVVYAATSNGLFKTLDGGTSWTALTGLPGEQARAVSVSPVDSSFILAGLQEMGMYVSTDGGATWQQVVAGLEPNGSLHQIIFDPTNPQVVYLSDTFSGVYRSTDGGWTWEKINDAGLSTRAVTGLAISSDGLHLYAATNGEGVFRLDLNGFAPQPAAN